MKTSTSYQLSGADFGVDRYHFNGKEKDDDWTGNSGDSYDFGARMYDSRLGRWLSIDPLADLYQYASVYCYSLNSPLQYFDRDGRRVKPARPEDAQFVVNYINSYDIVQDNPDGSISTVMTGAYLFGIQVTQGINGNHYYTGIDEKAFKKRLKQAKKNGMSKEQRESARKFYALLKADEIYELGQVREDNINANEKDADPSQDFGLNSLGSSQTEEGYDPEAPPAATRVDDLYSTFDYAKGGGQSVTRSDILLALAKAKADQFAVGGTDVSAFYFEKTPENSNNNYAGTILVSTRVYKPDPKLSDEENKKAEEAFNKREQNAAAEAINKVILKIEIEPEQ